ncbi:glycosyltransferase family 1 protein [Alloacidobacterium dinghuense]|uniref:Glycosyltransferase family 1 protein n=1 Tax=Alloacidobacterium dinghuense TaxID=2763107 RepID=A0A7G8BGA3_9BACT|nr:glycosyltransferase family 1 protein [Alloacidobacterium dinghuense]QNI31573.1 glycosyltransferase family 1 protein [Alloacidobacterium dinghuense]
MKSVVIVTGSFPPDICGVGDYTNALVDALKEQLTTVRVFYRENWSWRMLLQYAHQIREMNAEIINVQYPTRGYGASIVPHILGLFTGRAKKVVTLHEFSQASIKGKAAMLLFFLFADWIIFTTDYERELACRVAPWVRRKSSTVNIASNIPMQGATKRDIDVVYFGHICRTKGLEEFGNVIEQLRDRRDLLRVQVIGQIMPGSEEYATGIIERFKALGIEVVLDRPADEVSTLLARARVALLPFPDGMSLRRGSALAAMGNGALLLTTWSFTEAALLEGKCLMARTASDLYRVLVDALDNYSSYDRVRISGQDLARSFSWERVLSAYIQTINSL